MLEFRKLKSEDADKLFEIYSDKEAMKYRGSKPLESIEDAYEFVRNQGNISKGITTIRKAIVLTESDELIGSVMFRYPKNHLDKCEIGYSISRQFWGKGFGKEAVRLILSELDYNQEITQINAWSHCDNIPSIRILKSLGFKQKSVNKEHLLFVKSSTQ